jgi:phosphatidylserine decarboxylase
MYLNYAGPFVIIPLITLLILSFIYPDFAPFVIILTIFIFYFFRDIDYIIPLNKKSIHSACQGTVLKVIRKNGIIHIATFLSVFNIHVQYTPCSGIITNQEYKSGEFNVANDFEKSNLNERLDTTIKNEIFGNVVVRQIAGLIARRIVSFKGIGDQVNQNEPLGLIRFGSRVDIFIKDKPEYQVLVQSGDYVNIGQELIKEN